MSENTTPRPVPPHPRNGLPRVAPAGGKAGRPPYDWDAVIPELLHRVSGGVTLTRAIAEAGLPESDVYIQLAKEQWHDAYSQCRRARAVALLERNTERLEALADEADPSKERVNAARWSSVNAQWLAERSDAERWGREDRLKVQSVSAVRVIVETPPVTAQLPAAQEVTARVLSTHEARALTEGAAARVDTTQPVRVESATDT